MASKRNKLCVVLILVVSAGVLPLCPGCRAEKREKTVTAFRYDRNLETGDVVAEDDLVRARIPKTFADSIGGLLEEDEKDSLAVNRKLNRDVSKDDFAMIVHFVKAEYPGPEDNMSKDNVQITIRLDSEKTSDMVLRVGNHVNILGMLPTKEGTYKTYRIIEWLRVVAVDGQTDRRGFPGGSLKTAERGARPYKTIAVEMRRKDPDVSLQWSNLQTYLKGSAMIEICPSRFIPRKGAAGMIADELLMFTEKASPISSDEGGY